VKKQAKPQAVQKSRRKLLAAMSVGVVATKLPEHWTRPMVASVGLPAHARFTTPPCSAVDLTFSGRFGTIPYYTYTLTADAFGLPSSPAFNANFSYYNLGNLQTSSIVPLQSVAPGTHRATLSINVIGTAQCFPFDVNVYPVGTPGYTVCSDQTYYCAHATSIMTVIDGP